MTPPPRNSVLPCVMPQPFWSLSAAVAAVLACWLAAAPARGAMTAVGETAEDFHLSELTGQAVELRLVLARRAALVLFTSVGCIPCEESATAVRRLSERFGDRLEVLCVMLSERATVQHWMAGGVHYPGARILVGADGEAPYGTAQAYGVLGTPTAFLVGRDGTVHWRHVGRLTDALVDGELPGALAAAAAAPRSDGVSARAGTAPDTGCQRFLVDARVFVSVQFHADGSAGDIAWRDTVSGRQGDVPFRSAADAVLQVEMPGGWCSQAYYLGNLALLFRRPPWDPAATTVALGVSLD